MVGIFKEQIMTFPILAFGHPSLRKKAEEITKDYPGLEELIDSMFESMHKSNGVGLAAPQINKSIRLFLVDATPYADELKMDGPLKYVFINPQIVEETGEEWAFTEGCLSVPGINEDVFRKPVVTMEYYDENWEFHTKQFEGVIARIIQHEYDHLEGVIFTDRLSPLKKTLIKGRLMDISKGKVDVDYKMIFAPQRKKKKRF
jgi:peptide deformylase